MVSTDVAQLVRRRTVKAWSMSEGIGKTAGSKLAGGQGSEPGQQDSHMGQGLYRQSRFMFVASVVVLLNDNSFCNGETENFLTWKVSFENQRTGKLKVKCKISHFFSPI